MTTGVDVRVVTDDGVGLAVELAGAGPTLVLVHGFGGAKEDFADHVPALAAHHRVVTFDHRGHGESDAPSNASDYSLDRMAADILAVAEALDAPSFRLLGHSMGGMVARRLVLARPECVDALALMDTSPGLPPGMDPSLVVGAAQVALDRGMAALKELLDQFQPLETPAYQRVLTARAGYQEFQDQKFAALSPVMWATMATEMVDQPNQLHLLAGLTCPTLVIVGEQDATFLDVSREMASTIPGAVLDVIADAGHSPQFENPEAWLDGLSEFLSQIGEAEPVT